MVSSRIGAVIDALVSTWTAAGLKVLDGPVPSDDYGPAIWVGYDANGLEVSNFNAATTHSEWGPIGQRSRDEEFSIVCAAVALGDGTGYKSARDTALGLVDAADAAIRPRPADPSLGLQGSVGAPFLVAAIRVTDLFQEPTENAGPQARVTFTVDVKTRI